MERMPARPALGRRPFAAALWGAGAGTGARRAGAGRGPATGPTAGGAKQPYTHMWVDAEGETHLTELEMGDFLTQSYSAAPQAVKTDLGGATRAAAFTELPPGWDNPWHCCPAPQLVVTLSGEWFVETSDGARRTFTAGDVLYQDNVQDNAPKAGGPGQHYSGNAGAEPCRQVIVQLDRAPRVGPPTPL